MVVSTHQTPVEVAHVGGQTIDRIRHRYDLAVEFDRRLEPAQNL
jgi:hypothetical protein